MRNNTAWSTFTIPMERTGRGSLCEALSVELTFNLVKPSWPFFLARDFARKRARFRAISFSRGCRSPRPVVVLGCRVKFLRKKLRELAGVRLVKNVKLTVESLPELNNFQRVRADWRPPSDSCFYKLFSAIASDVNEFVGSLRSNVICADSISTINHKVTRGVN